MLHLPGTFAPTKQSHPASEVTHPLSPPIQHNLLGWLLVAAHTLWDFGLAHSLTETWDPLCECAHLPTQQVAVIECGRCCMILNGTEVLMRGRYLMPKEGA